MERDAMGTGPGAPPRLPHAVLDRDTRIMKARKIVALLGEDRFARSRAVLEIGCGSGVIASTLAELGPAGLDVHAADVVDSRIEKHGYTFRVVGGTTLPYPDRSFDVVISNHVIEHVGPPEAQLAHLTEMRRVLAPGGVAYLAVPNKWRVVEPHYRLPFLSWLPQSASDLYVRLARRGSHYDCLPLSLRQAMALFEAAGFDARDETLGALRQTLLIEQGDSRLATVFARRAPDWILAPGRAVMPTYVFLLQARP